MSKTFLRRRLLHVVIVLMVFYPLGVYVYTHSVSRSTAEALVVRSVADVLQYCADVKVAFEQVLEGVARDSPSGPETFARFRAELREPSFYRRLQRMVYSGGPAESLIRFAHLYDGEQPLFAWGQEPADRVVGEVTLTASNVDAVRDQVFDLTAGGTAPGFCRVLVPVDLGEGHTGRLVFGVASPEIGKELTLLSERLSMRALRMSLIGTSLLALVAAYIVRLNERTRSLELKLEEQKRLAYVGTIAAGLVHEIRNPLNSVKMNIQMIENRLTESGAQTNEYIVPKIARIRRETTRLEESVNNFLAFARPKPLARRWADLNEAVDHVVEFLEPACQNDGIRVARDYSKDLPQVYIDPEQLGQAVENLVRNAHQAVGKDGIIEIYTGRSGDHVEIRVSDDGPGIPPDICDKVFEIFFTTKEGGSGLGLTIVKQIVEAHGGTLSFDTIEKRGTTFTIRLPVGERT